MKRYEEETQTQKPSFPITFFTMVVFFFPAAVAAYWGDYVLAGAIAFIGIGCWFGFQKGALKAVGTIAIVVAGFYFAPQYAYLVEPKLNEWLNISGLANRLASILTVFFVFSCAVSVVISVTSWLLLKKGSTLSGANRFFGLTIGGLEAAIATLLFLGGIQMIEPMISGEQGAVEAPELLEEEVENGLVENEKASPVQFEGLSGITSIGVPEIARRTRESLVWPVVEQHNPFTKYPEYNPFPKVHQTVQFLSDRERMKALVEDGTLIERLNASSAFNDAMKKLSTDPAIQEMISSGGSFGIKNVISLMNSDTILEIIDQPGFLKEASEIINGTDLDQLSNSN